MSLNFNNKTYSDTTLSCSAGFNEFNADGPVYGPNGEWELDPDNNQCHYTRPVFATCKNNCPGGELSVTIYQFRVNN